MKISDILDDAIPVFEKQFKCRLCCHNYSGLILYKGISAYHQNPFCTHLKKKQIKLNQICIKFDQDAVQEHLRQNGGKPFFKQCHCGMSEAVFPIMEDEKLHGVLFAGPFLPSPQIPQTLAASPIRCTPCNIPLPKLPANQLDAFLAYGRLIAGLLGNGIRKPLQIPSSRKEIITAFLEAHYAGNIGLDDLARALELTPPRASEAVKRIFGKGFCELLREKRMEKAEILLKNTAFTIEEIARRCGIRNGTYFHRLFRKCRNVPPMLYRRSNRNMEV